MAEVRANAGVGNRQNWTLFFEKMFGRLANWLLDMLAFFLGNVMFFTCLPLVALRYLYLRLNRNFLSWKNGRTVSPEENVVLVTGCDSGIGKTTVLRLLEEGFTVFAGCLDARTARMTTYAQQLNTKPTSALLHIVQMDVTKQHEIEHVVKYLGDFLDRNASLRLWALVNNAGAVGAFGPLEFMSFELLQNVFEINVFGLFRATKALLPLMRRGGRHGGRIVNIAGLSSETAVPTSSSAFHNSSKAAVMSLNAVLRRELSIQFGIDSIAVCPAEAFATEFFNADRMLSSFNRLVDRTKPEVIEAYGGQERVERMRQALTKNVLASANRDLTPVIDDVVEAAVGTARPRSVYYPACDWKTRLFHTSTTTPTWLSERVVDSPLAQWILPSSAKSV